MRKKIITYTLSIVLISSHLFHITSCRKDSGPIIILPADTTWISFKNEIQPIFNNNNKCIMCHDSSNVTLTGLDLTDSVSYALLVGITSFGYPPVPLVKPFDIDSSVLWHKVAGTGVYGMQMPLMGTPLPDFEIDLIKIWINQGAKDN